MHNGIAAARYIVPLAAALLNLPFPPGLTMRVRNRLAAIVLCTGMLALAGGVARAAEPAYKAAANAEAAGPVMEWQVGAIFTGFWVFVAGAVAVMSRSSKRADKPPKKEESAE